jgi:MFS family permease
MHPEHIPKGIKILTLARGIRWFGWGMCETLIPVLLFSFSHSYVEAGIFRAIYDVVFILALPFVSTLGDRIPAKSLILFALALYPIIGLSYFLAGALGTALFIIIARALNGVTWCCDNIGGDTYLRRFALDSHLSKTFGYLSSLPNFAWMIAALISIPFLPYIKVHYLFLAIVVTSIVAYLVMKRAPIDQVPVQLSKPKYFSHLIESAKGMRHWKVEIWILAFLAFFVSCLDLLGTFFLPLFTYNTSNDLSRVVIITVVYAIPSALAFWLGMYIDRVSKWVFIAISFFVSSVLLGLLAISSGYFFQVIGIFILGIITVGINLAVQAQVTKVSTVDHYGRIGGLIAGADEFGSILGPVAIGLLTDIGGMRITFLTLAGIAVAVAVGCFVYRAK